MFNDEVISDSHIDDPISHAACKDEPPP